MSKNKLPMFAYWLVSMSISVLIGRVNKIVDYSIIIPELIVAITLWYIIFKLFNKFIDD